MDSTLAALQARQAVDKMRRLRDEIQQFTSHARMLKASGKTFDSGVLLDEASRLIKSLRDARLEALGPQGSVDSLARSLPSRPAAGTGMSPAAQWGPELRAASRQLTDAIGAAESAVFQLRDSALEGMSSPTRTQTGDPANLFEVVMVFIDVLSHLIEGVRRPHQK